MYHVCRILIVLYIAKLLDSTYATPFVKCNYFHISELSVVLVLEDAISYKRSFSPWPYIRLHSLYKPDRLLIEIE